MNWNQKRGSNWKQGYEKNFPKRSIQQKFTESFHNYRCIHEIRLDFVNEIHHCWGNGWKIKTGDQRFWKSDTNNYGQRHSFHWRWILTILQRREHRSYTHNNWISKGKWLGGTLPSNAYISVLKKLSEDDPQKYSFTYKECNHSLSSNQLLGRLQQSYFLEYKSSQ